MYMYMYISIHYEHLVYILYTDYFRPAYTHKTFYMYVLLCSN